MRLHGPQGRCGRVRKISSPQQFRSQDRRATTESLLRLYSYNIKLFPIQVIEAYRMIGGTDRLIPIPSASWRSGCFTHRSLCTQRKTSQCPIKKKVVGPQSQSENYHAPDGKYFLYLLLSYHQSYYRL